MPTTTSGQPGFVNATAVGTGTVTGPLTVSGSGPWTITVPFTASGTTNGFNLTYGVGAGAAVTAPCATGAYTFTTSTCQNGGAAHTGRLSPLIFDGVSATLAAGAFGASAGNLNSLASAPPSQQPPGRHYSFSLLRRTTAMAMRGSALSPTPAAQTHCQEAQQSRLPPTPHQAIPGSAPGMIVSLCTLSAPRLREPLVQ